MVVVKFFLFGWYQRFHVGKSKTFEVLEVQTIIFKYKSNKLFIMHFNVLENIFCRPLGQLDSRVLQGRQSFFKVDPIFWCDQ